MGVGAGRMANQLRNFYLNPNVAENAAGMIERLATESATLRKALCETGNLVRGVAQSNGSNQWSVVRNCRDWSERNPLHDQGGNRKLAPDGTWADLVTSDEIKAGLSARFSDSASATIHNDAESLPPSSPQPNSAKKDE